MRILDRTAVNLDLKALGLMAEDEAVLLGLTQIPHGIVLVTGPTGSGKTTTLATMIDWINTNLERHIVTIEDPIEYYHDHKRGLVTQREIGADVPDFPEAMRRVLRPAMPFGLMATVSSL